MQMSLIFVDHGEQAILTPYSRMAYSSIKASACLQIIQTCEMPFVVFLQSCFEMQAVHQILDIHLMIFKSLFHISFK